MTNLKNPKLETGTTAVQPVSTPSPAREQLLRSLPLSERRRQLDGIATAVLEGGEGPPLVLLHGPGAYAAHWMRVIPALAQHFSLVAPDLPGHGRTALGSEPLSVDRVLSWLEALVDQTCDRPPILLGELVGGAIAARFAALHAQKASQLVLVNSFGLSPFRPTAEFAAALGAFGARPDSLTHQNLWDLCSHGLDTLRQQLGELWTPFEAHNVECARSPTTQTASAALMQAFALPAIPSELLAKIACPTCLIWGRYDLATPLAIAQEASARYGWPLHVIERANDAPAMDQPRAFVRAALEELKGSGESSRGTGSAKHRHEVETLVIGGGQAGLATSYFLSKAGIEQLVVERREELGGAWHDRWDSFHLVAPNFCLLLPGMPYSGPDPEAFMPRAGVIEYVKAYANFCAAPVRLGCAIRRLSVVGNTFEAEAESTTFSAREVVLATGPYPKPKRPKLAKQLAPHVQQLHSQDYRRPGQLAQGGVLVVGTGQSGTQIAEELLRAGRDVHLAVSMCPGVPRRYRGRDIIYWLLKSFQNRERLELPFPTVGDLPTPAARFDCNPHCSGNDGGHDINLRRFARQGMHLYGRLEAVDGAQLEFSSDLAERLRFADSKFDEEFRPLFDAYIAAAGVTAPPDDRPKPDDFVPPVVTRLDLDAANIANVIWATGYALDFSWVDLPIFDEWGYPRHVRGVTEQPGLYVVGLPWLYSEPSSVFAGVGDDARYVVEHLVAHSRIRAEQLRV
ncbi:MAG TPA: alpha/beta fold hydrolase [Polyangiaceae bacterium]|nr:alpha/beta fold hydrolase [Polyangiaceae bacterium]